MDILVLDRHVWLLPLPSLGLLEVTSDIAGGVALLNLVLLLCFQ